MRAAGAGAAAALRHRQGDTMAVPIAHLAKELPAGAVEHGDAVAAIQAEDFPGMMGFAPGQFEKRRAALRGRQVEAVHLGGKAKG